MIKVLDKKIADKIAAGEVVERPLSIIKELVENSIDAGSNKITVEIKNGGKTYIRVTDNGCGIEHTQVGIAFLRHATSKIFDESDLDNIHTLGFRGEALASIAAVSRVEMVTKTADVNFGKKILVYGGDIVENAQTGAPDGTTVIVRDLFYNTPARLKFLRSDKAESSKIIEFVTHMSLAYPDVKFMMINNDKILFSTNGRGNRLHVISTVTSNKEVENLIGFQYEKEGVLVKGYISNPSYSKATKRDQIFFVNGRVVESKIIEKGIESAYSDRLFEGRFPICYLFIDVDATTLDVNIHPNKTQVRFFNEDKVIESVAEGIISALNSEEAVTKIQPKVENAFQLEKNGLHKNNYENLIKYTGKPAKNTVDNNEIDKIKNDENQSFDYVNIKKVPIDVAVTDLKSDNFLEKDEIKTEFKDVKEILFDYKTEMNSNITRQIDFLEDHRENMEKKNRFDFSHMDIIGQFFGTYIQLKDENAIYFIDQHAAHERVFFEKFLREFNTSEKNKQVILFPIILNVDYRHKELEKIWIEILNKAGFSLEEFGVNTYKVTEIPMFFKLEEAERFLFDFVDNINEYGDFSKKNTIDKIATKACKAAIKANDILKTEEIHQLLEDMSKCNNPFSCPHGRPTFIKMTKSDMEKRFKRT